MITGADNRSSTFSKRHERRNPFQGYHFMEQSVARQVIRLVFIMSSSLAQRSALAFLQQTTRYHQRHGWRQFSPQSAHMAVHARTLDLELQKSVLAFFGRRPYSRTTVSPSAGLYMSAVDEEESETANKKTVDSAWDVSGLKKEVFRLIQRCHKKVGQSNQRLTKAKQTVENITSDPAASVEELEKCPDTDALQFELQQLQARLRKLNTLEESLTTIGNKKKTVLPKDIASLAIDLGVSDAPPSRPSREKKEKGPRRDSPSRRPYRRYYSHDNIEIRVGKTAEDNDQLTLSPEHRDGLDCWMHASGCPGSHVVIRCSQESVPEAVLQDAAALAARQSKCTGSVIQVSLTRCRDIRKPPLAPAGLVMLTGKVRTVTVNMREAEARLERLEKTVLVN